LTRRTSPGSVIQGYVEYLNGLVNQTVSVCRLLAIETDGSPKRLITRYQNGRILPLRLRPRGWLHFHQLAQPVGPKVNVLSATYKYSYSLDPDNEDAWIFRYEYERTPTVENRPQSHLHVNALHRVHGEIDFDRVHFPTARLSLEHVLAALILEFGIQPRSQDAISRLRESYLGWVARRTDLKEDPTFP